MSALAEEIGHASTGLGVELEYLKALLRGDAPPAAPAPSHIDTHSPLDDIAERFGLTPFARALLLRAVRGRRSRSPCNCSGRPSSPRSRPMRRCAHSSCCISPAKAH